MSYQVAATWDNTGRWVVTIPDIPSAITQCRRLDRIPADAAEVIEIQTGRAVDPSAIELHVHIPGDSEQIAEEARQLREHHEALRVRVEKRTNEAVMLLRRQGLSVRDVGKLTGVSYQRVSQIDKEAS
ncbi:hypothetical protein [Pseudonocardia xinjiangensis]|uniref:Sigma-70-like protein n=1 Tax=Pseudonocardia xinjiangensis TaxID=75289 RepID=A0ABX1RJG0_9PSEU|nr:hypothetical protein [Pseudonocardia xinjiangensis]NMH80507.1 hypothetical protein [Pseudonocardia xinjiangensis]